MGRIPVTPRAIGCSRRFRRLVRQTSKTKEKAMKKTAFMRVSGAAAATLATVLTAAAPTTERANVSSLGEQDNCIGLEPSISGDGRFVAFTSCSTNLVPDDTNG